MHVSSVTRGLGLSEILPACAHSCQISAPPSLLHLTCWSHLCISRVGTLDHPVKKGTRAGLHTSCFSLHIQSLQLEAEGRRVQPKITCNHFSVTSSKWRPKSAQVSDVFLHFSCTTVRYVWIQCLAVACLLCGPGEHRSS